MLWKNELNTRKKKQDFNKDIREQGQDREQVNEYEETSSKFT